MPELSFGQFQLVYNMLSLAIAAMLGSFIFFIVGRGQLTPKYRPALIMSALVVGIAGYHYFRIFESWEAAYVLTDAGTYVASGKPFNDAYRYVDWLLTVPLLVAELVAVLALSKAKRVGLMAKLVIAATAMVALGYPGEVASDAGTRTLWGLLSTVPFVYILYVLFVELGKSLDRQSGSVKKLVDGLRYIVLATWGVYPIAYMLPSLIDDEANAEVARQVMYSVGDVLAKPLFGLLVLGIALAKSREDGYVEAGGTDVDVVTPDNSAELTEA